MRTEITVPFAIDTAPIEAKLQGDLEQIVRERICEAVDEAIEDRFPREINWYGDKDGKRSFELAVNARIDAFLEAHAGEIIDEAALLLAKRASRDDRWREVLAEVKEEM